LQIIAGVAGVVFLLAVGLDTFQTIILPRRPAGRFRITRLFFLVTWAPWAAIARKIKRKQTREDFYGIYGPASLILLLVVWAALLEIGFALLFFAMGSPFHDVTGHVATSALDQFRTDLYVSGTTLFTLGLGDILPQVVSARAMIITEAGVGLGFVALVIGYVPVLYGAFSKREVSIALLDGRAGSPPTAGELLRRHGFDGGDEAIVTLLAEWERWSAELLESHVSYPILCYYRSQHDNQSWLSALTAVLDACSVLITSLQGTPVRQAQLTFAMARHALVDLVLVFHLKEQKEWAAQQEIDRLPMADFRRLCGLLNDTDIELCGDPASEERLKAIRKLYEPYAHALAEYLGMPVSDWITEPKKNDQWSTVAGLRSQKEIARKLAPGAAINAAPSKEAREFALVGETPLHEEHKY
jgi:Ion channel